MTYLDDGAFAQHVVMNQAGLAHDGLEGLQGLFATERRWSRESPAGPERNACRARAIGTQGPPCLERRLRFEGARLFLGERDCENQADGQRYQRHARLQDRRPLFPEFHNKGQRENRQYKA